MSGLLPRAAAEALVESLPRRMAEKVANELTDGFVRRGPRGTGRGGGRLLAADLAELEVEGSA